MGSFREKLQRFMYGRYGNDKLNSFLMIFALIMLVLSWLISVFFDIFALAAIIYSYYRMMSRNYAKRSAENAKYMAITSRIKNVFSKYRKMWSQRKTHRFFKCPGCKCSVRVPKGHGRVQVTCPKCRTSFERTT